MRILLLTENPILALGLEAALLQAGHSSLWLSSTVPLLRELLAAAIESAEPPNVLVLDHACVGMTVLNELKEEMKQIPTVLWADELTVEFGYQSLTVGVRGILRKSWPAKVMVAALETVATGELCFEKSLSDQFLMSRKKALTPQEGKIIAMLAQGKKNKEIAWELHITEGTIKVYMSRLFTKLGVGDRLELALYGIRNLGYKSHPEGTVMRTFCASTEPLSVNG